MKRLAGERVDILMATYNGERFIVEQIESLLNQTYKNVRIFIRDDGSDDATLDKIRFFVSECQGKVVLIEDSLSRLGCSKSFMRLLDYADSKYIMFSDQDDVWLPEKVEVTLNKMREVEGEDSSVSALVFTDLKVVDEKLNLISESFWACQKLNANYIYDWKKVLAQNVVTGCTIMINSAAKSVCLPMPDLFILHDHWLAASISKRGRVGYLSSPTILYRQHGGNVFGAKGIGVIYMSRKLIKVGDLIRFYMRADRAMGGELGVVRLLWLKFKISVKRMLA